MSLRPPLLSHAPGTFPLVLPHRGAGEVETVGPEDRAGERVVLPAEQAVWLPNGTGFAEGACSGIPLLTALRAVALGEQLEGGTAMVAGVAGRGGSDRPFRAPDTAHIAEHARAATTKLC